MDYIQTHIQSIVAIAPRREALETPVTVTKETLTDYYNHPYDRTKITVDNERNIG